jgi:hypothetical protein
LIRVLDHEPVGSETDPRADLLKPAEGHQGKDSQKYRDFQEIPILHPMEHPPAFDRRNGDQKYAE